VGVSANANAACVAEQAHNLIMIMADEDLRLRLLIRRSRRLRRRSMRPLDQYEWQSTWRRIAPPLRRRLFGGATEPKSEPVGPALTSPCSRSLD
jgi:hypothetical protein